MMMNESEQYPLVTIIVITYNSAQYVLETLESVKNQSYKNIEVIVTDDASKDSTVSMCKEWLSKNSQRFASTELLTVSSNTGIVFNCNRGLRKAKGDWIKYIAGDDILLPDCIKSFVQYASDDPQRRFMACNVVPFKNEVVYKPFSFPRKYFDLPSRRQLKTLVTRGNFIIGASLFLHRRELVSMNGFDERFPMIEDFPFVVKCCDQGHKIFLNSEPLVRYRMHELNSSMNKSLLLDSLESFYKEIYPELLLRHHWYMLYWHRKMIELKKKIAFNNNLANRVTRYAISLLSPMSYLEKVFRLFGAERNFNFNERILIIDQSQSKKEL